MSWESAEKAAKKHDSSGPYIRLAEDGESVVGAFCGEPFPREVVWDGQAYRAPVGDEKCSLRVTMNFFVPGQGMKIIEGGSVWFKSVLQVRAKYGLDKQCFEVQRHGGKGDPKTTYSILPDRQIDDAMRAEIAKASLHDLEDMTSGSTKFDAADLAAPADKKISDSEAQKLIAMAKLIPRSAADAWLQSLGVAKVRDIRDMDSLGAQMKLEAIVRQFQAPQVEEDPFA